MPRGVSDQPATPQNLSNVFRQMEEELTRVILDSQEEIRRAFQHPLYSDDRREPSPFVSYLERRLPELERKRGSTSR
jgi:hypothetical protein